jgi:hypothetical protein
MTDTPAVVAHVLDDSNVVINRGELDGVRIGARYLIFGMGPRILDPVTGEQLGELEVVRGTGSVIHVQEHISTIESTKTRPSRATLKRIKRKDPLSQFYRIPDDEEEIEEREGPVKVPFESVRVGDFARPI